jgi:DNA-binding HxlR family transcriptional regulator
LKESIEKGYTYLVVTEPLSKPVEFREPLSENEGRQAHELLEAVTAKWPLSVLRVLAQAQGPLRFSRVLERVEGISQKVLTQALRTLARHGLITRTLYPQVPPRVEYELTPLGVDLLAQVLSLWGWIQGRLAEFAAAGGPEPGSS